MTYQSDVAQIVADIERSRTWDTRQADTPIAAAVERMADTLRGLEDDVSAMADELNEIERQVRAALARHGGDLDYPSTRVGLVRLALELWQPGDERLD